MVNPPNAENCSKKTYELYCKERKDRKKSLETRAKLLCEKLNQMERIKCNEVQGIFLLLNLLNNY